MIDDCRALHSFIVCHASTFNHIQLDVFRVPHMLSRLLELEQSLQIAPPLRVTSKVRPWGRQKLAYICICQIPVLYRMIHTYIHALTPPISILKSFTRPLIIPPQITCAIPLAKRATRPLQQRHVQRTVMWTSVLPGMCVWLIWWDSWCPI